MSIRNDDLRVLAGAILAVVFLSIVFIPNGITNSALARKSVPGACTVPDPTVEPSDPYQLCTMLGASGDDLLVGSSGNDIIYGMGGNDKIEGKEGNDKLYGVDGNDNLVGGSGADKLFGGNGNDKLSGNAGSDELTGGSGADSFDCGSGVDTITDFNSGAGDTKTSNCEFS